jgi:hypothetical protein
MSGGRFKLSVSPSYNLIAIDWPIHKNIGHANALHLLEFVSLGRIVEGEVNEDKFVGWKHNSNID